MLKERKNLSTKSLLKSISNYFKTIKDEERKRICQFSLKDCLMAGLAIFGLKYPSLLKFEKERKENDPLIGNLERLYNIDNTPCDTQLRERLDVVDPALMRKAFNIVIAKVQRDKVLEDFKFMDNRYLLSIDGTGYFHSKDVFCDNCCEKKDKEGNIISYHHNLLAGSIVHHTTGQKFISLLNMVFMRCYTAILINNFAIYYVKVLQRNKCPFKKCTINEFSKS